MNIREISDKFREGTGFGRQLQIKLFLSFSLSGTVILTVAFAIFYHEASRMLLEQSSRDTYQQLEQVEFFFENMEEETMHIAQSLLLDYEHGKLFNRAYKDGGERIMMIRDLFDQTRDVLDNYAYIDSVYYYGYDGFVLGVGQNYQRYVLNGMEDESFPGKWFYDSDYYSELLQARSSVNWVGGLGNENFGFYQGSGDEKYFSLLYRIGIPYSHPIVMVINLKESYFSQLYVAEEIEDYHSRYVVDKEGKIISSLEKERIGTMCSYDMESILNENVILTEIEDGSRQMQVVFGSLSGMNWTVVDEISVGWLKRDVNTLRKYLYYIVFISLVISFGVSRFWIRRITAPLMRLTEKMHRTEEGHLGEKLDTKVVEELGVVGRQFNSMSESIVTLIDKNRRIEEEKRRYEMETLWQQINPHFIYNTLNTIKWMAVLAKANNITACVEAFGNLLKPIFRHRQNEEYSLEEELSYITDYVKIMNYRYGNLLKLAVVCPENCMDYGVPRLILQPILENSILHGMRGAGVPLHLSVNIEAGEDLLLTIRDDGRGMEEENLRILRKGLESSEDMSAEEKEKIGRAGIGTSNVCKRIRLLYGNCYGVWIESTSEQGTRVDILLPVKEKRTQDPSEGGETE